MTARLRPELADLPAYTPGKTVPGAIKIASNETVDGPLPSVRAAIEQATDGINRYPDNGYVELQGTPGQARRRGASRPSTSRWAAARSACASS